MRLFISIILFTLLSPSAHAISLHYQFLSAGKAELKLTQAPDNTYLLSLNAKFLSKKQRNISRGMFDGQNLIPQYYEDDKRKIGDDILSAQIFDPVSALWQIMLASKETCDGVAIRYFNGKNYYRLNLTKMQMLDLTKKYQKLQAFQAFSCMLTYLNEKTDEQKHSGIIFLRIKTAPHPILYQFKNHRNIQFTLTDVTPN
ncbi:MAG: DUF3108 domain-containing protein [Alphaproteobacteria bacterium]|nr:DUF3108 domain-containing protein [Alphaproteobacteria bacterium]